VLDWFRRLLPREDRFFDLFERHAGLITAGAEALEDLLTGTGPVDSHCRHIVAIEKEADAVARDVLLGLRKTFLTPFDRGDIKDLIVAMDDALDAMQRAAKTISRFEQRLFPTEMLEIGRLAREAAARVSTAIPLLRRAVENADRLGALTEEVVALEDQADLAYDRGLDALYRTAAENPMAYIVGSEIFEHLENVADRLEDVANQINAIVIESV
jgi:predicted phosphate transport protein (TIGR00153 family)